MKPAFFIGPAKDALRAFPRKVRRVLGVAIGDAQAGDEHPRVKALTEGISIEQLIRCLDRLDCSVDVVFRPKSARPSDAAAA